MSVKGFIKLAPLAKIKSPAKVLTGLKTGIAPIRATQPKQMPPRIR
jgi:hypothetical protein